MDKQYFLRLDEDIGLNFIERLLPLVSTKKREQIGKFKFDIDKALSLYAEIIVRYSICTVLGIKNTDILFEKNEYGKPHFKDYPELYFNISHTRNAVCVSILDKPTGIDIERIRIADIRIAERFFASNELKYIIASPKPNECFYEVWTKKEAYIKYLGKGLSVPLNSFDVFNEDFECDIITTKLHDYIISICNTSNNCILIDEINLADIKEMATYLHDGLLVL